MDISEALTGFKRFIGEDIVIGHFADVVAYRLSQRPIRSAAALGSIITVLTYLTAQMVDAGSLIKLMFGLPYEVAVIIVGCLMIAYVLFGGMLATTWVQIKKAVLLLGGATLLVILTLVQFGFNYGELFSQAAQKYGDRFLEPGGLISNPVDAFSLGLALMFGTILPVAGLTLAGASALSHDIYVGVIRKGQSAKKEGGV